MSKTSNDLYPSHILSSVSVNLETGEIKSSVDLSNVIHDLLKSQMFCLLQPGASLEQTHIFVLAHILRRPIIVYGVKYYKSFRGETLGYTRFQGKNEL